MPPRRRVFPRTHLYGLPDFLQAYLLEFLEINSWNRVICCSRIMRRYDTFPKLAHKLKRAFLKANPPRHVFILNKNTIYSDQTRTTKAAIARFKGQPFCHHVYYGDPPIPEGTPESLWAACKAKHKVVAYQSHRHLGTGQHCPLNVPYKQQTTYEPPPVDTLGGNKSTARCFVCRQMHSDAIQNWVALVHLFRTEMDRVSNPLFTSMWHTPDSQPALFFHRSVVARMRACGTHEVFLRTSPGIKLDALVFVCRSCYLVKEPGESQSIQEFTWGRPPVLHQ